MSKPGQEIAASLQYLEPVPVFPVPLTVQGVERNPAADQCNIQIFSIFQILYASHPAEGTVNANSGGMIVLLIVQPLFCWFSTAP
jgi:hypothetical protein